MQGLLNSFYYARRWLLNAITYLSMRLYGLEVTFQNIRDEKYNKLIHSNRNLDDAKDLDSLLTVAKDCQKVSVDSRTAVTEKAKTLLTLSSVMIGLVGLLLPKQLAFQSIFLRVILFVAVFALLNTVALLLVFFNVRPDMVVTLDQSDVILSKDDVKKSLINSYLQCSVYTDNHTEYLADLYKTVRFFFLSALSIVALLFSFNFFNNADVGDSRKVIADLRSDPSLIELLRGPKGDAGKDGPEGKPSAPGKDAHFDNSERIRPRLSEPKEDAPKQK